MCKYEVIKGYHEDNDEMETMRYWGEMWNSRQIYE